jgi:hypothetical protein
MLLPNECFREDRQDLQVEQDLNGTGSQSLTDEDINNKYKRGEIRIVTEQARYPLDTIPGMLAGGKYTLDPEYQRRKRWNNARKSRLIESFIMNVPIPPIFLYEVEYSKYEVMDGQQRLNAINDFYANRFALEGLQYWKELNNRFYNDLPDQVRSGIDRRYLSSVVLLEETAKTTQEAEHLKRIVFERLNSGGEKLTAQETRNALLNGKFNQLCIKLATNDKFRQMWSLPLESEIQRVSSIDDLSYDPKYDPKRLDIYKKMEDVELVLRFFAYRHLDKQGQSSIDSFLDEFLKEANNWPDELLEKLREIFENTIDLIYEVFGASAFIPFSGKIKQHTPRKSVYDPLMQVFSRYLIHGSILIEKAQKIKDHLSSQEPKLDLFKDSNGLNRDISLFDGRYNNPSDVRARIKYFEEVVNIVISQQSNEIVNQ